MQQEQSSAVSTNLLARSCCCCLDLEDMARSRRRQQCALHTSRSVATTLVCFCRMSNANGDTSFEKHCSLTLFAVNHKISAKYEPCATFSKGVPRTFEQTPPHESTTTRKTTCCSPPPQPLTHPKITQHEDSPLRFPGQRDQHAKN